MPPDQLLQDVTRRYENAMQQYDGLRQKSQSSSSKNMQQSSINAISVAQEDDPYLNLPGRKSSKRAKSIGRNSHNTSAYLSN